MERNIHMDEFDKFLKEKADQYKLYPSDKVWNNINGSIHSRRKWPYVFLTLFLLLGTAVVVDYSSYNYIFPGKNSLAHFTTDQNGNSPVATILNNSESNAKNISTLQTGNTSIIKQDKEKALHDGGINNAADAINAVNNDEPRIVINHPDVKDGMASDENYINTSNLIIKTTQAKNTSALKNKIQNRDIVEEDRPLKKIILWGGEVFRRSKFTWQVSFSPTVSYRKLTSGLGQVDDIFRGAPYSTQQSNTSVNSLVTHKPAIGAEVGANLVYKLSDNFVIKGGLQLNYSRYQVKAYSSKPQIATLALNNNRGGTDSINFISTMENYEGRGSSWYNNEYLQISMPIGFEWSALGNSTFKWNIAASAQPVYNFANNVYLLSTDFKHYVQDPSLIRKWNINAGVETFVSYDLGLFKVQAGPQLRYQLASSYKSEYPIKEHLVDFGFKVGFTKTIR